MAKKAQTLRAREDAKKQQEAFSKPEMAPDPERPSTLNDKQKKQLKALFKQDCDFQARKKGLNLKHSNMFDDAKGDGFDPAVLKRVFRAKRADPDELAAEEELEALYLGALDDVEVTRVQPEEETEDAE